IQRVMGSGLISLSFDPRSDRSAAFHLRWWHTLPPKSIPRDQCRSERPAMNHIESWVCDTWVRRVPERSYLESSGKPGQLDGRSLRGEPTAPSVWVVPPSLSRRFDRELCGRTDGCSLKCQCPARESTSPPCSSTAPLPLDHAWRMNTDIPSR